MAASHTRSSSSAWVCGLGVAALIALVVALFALEDRALAARFAGGREAPAWGDIRAAPGDEWVRLYRARHAAS